MKPENFFDTMKTAQGRNKGVSQQNYEKDRLLEIAPYLDLDKRFIKNTYYGEDKDPLSLIKYEVNNVWLNSLFPIKCKPQLMRNFVWDFSKTAVCKEFIKLTDKDIKDVCIVFPMKELTTWIMHTLGVVSKQGNGKIIIPAKHNQIADIVIEPFKTFLETRYGDDI